MTLKHTLAPAKSTRSERGPPGHARRNQIVEAALDHFRVHGYQKTSVSDLARAIGVSSAYIYRFFESKQAIGELVCEMSFGRIDDACREVANSDSTAVERMRKLTSTLLESSFNLFFHEAKVHDMVVVAVEHRWCSATDHHANMLAVIRKIVLDGRASGEFERKTPIDKVVHAIAASLSSFSNPVMLSLRAREELVESANAVTDLVLRSLAP